MSEAIDALIVLIIAFALAWWINNGIEADLADLGEDGEGDK